MPLTQPEAFRMVQSTLGAAFDLQRFRTFTANLLSGCEMLAEGVQSGAYIPENFREDVASYQRLVKFQTSDGQRLDVLTVKLKSPAKLARSRFMQRNFISRYLNGGWGGTEKDAALVAFTADDVKDWRFSLVYKKYIFDEQGVRVALSEPRRASFLVGPHEGTHTVEQQLARLLTASTPLTLETLEAAFMVEPVEKAFFTEYKTLYDKLVQALATLRVSTPALDAELATKAVSTPNFAKRLLGQLVFLYFLQRKGWLGVPRTARWGEGSPAWLRERFASHTATAQAQDRFFNDILEPLFYDALARNRADAGHWHEALDCRIPFLNGGLFEPLGTGEGYDWQNVDILLPDSLFADILSVFDRYNFTVREDEPLDKEVAVDPEMLGKVFENLLEVEERGKLGTFYTPRDIVHYMCREALTYHLDHALNVRWEVENPVSKPTQISLLPQSVKSEQLHIAARAKPKRREKVSLEDIEAFIRADEIVEHSPSKTARKNAAKERSPESARPLPPGIAAYAKEVDAALAAITVCDPAIGSGAFCVGMMHEIVRARVALAEKAGLENCSVYDLKRHAIQHSLYGVDIDASAVDIAKLRLWLSLVVDEDDFESVRPLPNLDYRIMSGNSLDSWQYDYSKSLLHDVPFKRLHEAQTAFFNATDRGEKVAIRQRIDACKAELGCHNSFDWTVDFHAVFDPRLDEHNKGFDVIIANPPYVRQEKIKALKACLKAVFGNFFCGTADLYTYFYALAVQSLLKPLGHCCFIAPNKFFRAAYGKNLRSLFTSQAARVRRIVDFGELSVFDEAATDPAILLVQRASTRPDEHFNAASIKDMGALRSLWSHVQECSQPIPVRQLKAEGWSLENPKVQALLDTIRKAGQPLGRVVNGGIYYGIKTGLNEAFVIDGATRERLIAEDPKAAELIKPWLRGRDLTRWRAGVSGRYVINIQCGGNHRWPWTGAKPADAEKLFQQAYPSLCQHMQSYREKLIARADQGQYFWELRACAYNDAFAKPKIIWPDMAKRFRAPYDSSGSFCGNTAYFLPTEDLCIMGVLSSSLFDWYMRQIFQFFGDPWNGGRARFFTQYMETVPIPDPTPAQHKTLTSAVQSILAAKDADPDADVSALEADIDRMVFDLYGLTKEERAIILTTLRGGLNEND